MANVAKHAGAQNVRIDIQQGADSLRLKVCDDGRGISRETVQHTQAAGLLEIRERARNLGGHVNIKGRPGLGTVVTIRVPLRSGDGRERKETPAPGKP